MDLNTSPVTPLWHLDEATAPDGSIALVPHRVTAFTAASAQQDRPPVAVLMGTEEDAQRWAKRGETG